jgi:hypothetical protein
VTEVKIPKSLPHGLAVREGFAGTVEHAENYRYHVSTCDCKCGTAGYRIFVNETHYDLGKRYQQYVAKMLDDIHAHNEKHPDVIQIPMDAEFPT